ncbi:MAG: ROK family protein [Gammaproteobacteria bacterium]|nr:ROK family protein [Gammaproteobacteria bacterium]
MKFIAIVTRTLKAGKTYDDYRKAWFHTNGFGIPTTMYTAINAFNPREIISIGIMDGDLKDLSNSLEIDVKDRLAQPMDDIIESAIIRNFGMVAAVDDFSLNGQLTYVPPQVDGVLTDYNEIAELLEKVASEIRKASARRDKLKASP